MTALVIVILVITLLTIPVVIYKANKKQDISLLGSVITRAFLALTIVYYLFNTSQVGALLIHLGLISVLISELVLNSLYVFLRKYTLELQYKQSLLKINSLESKFKFIVDHSPSGIFILSPAGKFDYVNKYIENLFGYSIEEFRELTYKEVTKERHWNSVQRLIDHCVEGKSDELSANIKVILKSGEIRTAKITASAIKNGSWKVIGSFILLDDNEN